MLQAIDNESFFRIFAIVKPVDLALLDAKISMDGSPFFVKNIPKLAIVKGAERLAEEYAQESQQNGEEDEIGKREAESKPTCDPCRLRDPPHDLRRRVYALFPENRAYIRFPEPYATAWSGHLSSILLRRCRI